MARKSGTFSKTSSQIRVMQTTLDEASGVGFAHTRGLIHNPGLAPREMGIARNARSRCESSGREAPGSFPEGISGGRVPVRIWMRAVNCSLQFVSNAASCL
ncbi:hypothetical protein L596_010554 [Steinernema carpocapsae]|uniref:Uncharacterized protein n=1 Tax=Steinernema carpocapsae TaxID=34508 RepID=A0A4U5PJ77_STECR|nr:hypothetical protein L596_010554 [Steinernema carpocapsae]